MIWEFIVIMQSNYALRFISPVDSFIIDISDKTLMKLFSDEDRDFIMTSKLVRDPEIEEGLMEHLFKYRQASIITFKLKETHTNYNFSFSSFSLMKCGK
jgi:hypothetical protein